MTFSSYKRQFANDPEHYGKVAVLFGGVSAERDISLKSGKDILNALSNAGVNAFGIDLGGNVCQQLLDKQFDCAFIALHGGDGEGGKVQAFLELMGVPYTGSDSAASSLAMNKLHTKQIWKSNDLPTAKYESIDIDSDLEEIWEILGAVFVKPAREGSSFGISPARNLDELVQAVSLAREYDDTVIAETLIDGREFSVGILGGVPLPPIEIINHAEFYDFTAKYESEKTEYICPPQLTQQRCEEMQRYALRAFECLGCSGWGRVDFMQNSDGEVFLLEANTVPGMTDHSLVPMAAAVAGLTYKDLVLEVLSFASINGASVGSNV